jgi:hypothetical protein
MFLTGCAAIPVLDAVVSAWCLSRRRCSARGRPRQGDFRPVFAASFWLFATLREIDPNQLSKMREELADAV